ncbi:ATP-binding/permease protein CydC [Lentibacillus sp. JNUCC-1]|uniref:thiol reductant ABC exporter subunit CydD n=1 Tax=Lentibacillus sp. JNUCC-1 TaxID=2654513 RepID=UPI0012E94C9F|nr:thiol reductant ABC exporter subunit CydD [Lentibacillus sp. JNUCC-1]MUV36384.1 ATP-binding/permease protein CydC [Lentibacillus sp. JNUCC-1]
MTQTRTRGLPRYKGSRLLHGSLTLLTLIEVAAIIAQAIFLARAVTFLFQGTPVSDIWSEIGLFLVAFISRYMTTHAQTMLAQRYAADTARRLRTQLVQRYFTRELYFIQQKGVGHLTTLMMDGVDHVKAYLEIISMRMIKTMIVPAVIVVYVWTIDVSSAVILVVTVPVVIMFMILLGKAAQAMADKQYDTYKRLSNHFIDSLKGLETLVYLGQSKKHAERIDQVNTDYRKATMRTLKVAFLSSFALDFFTSLSIAFVAVGLGLRLIDGHIDLLPALTILVLAPEYYSPIKQVGKDYHATLDGQVAMGEINAVLAEQENENNQERVLVVQNNRTFPALSFDNVSLRLNDKPVLSRLTFAMPKGWIGLVGPSGSGKSSFINVLAGRLLPVSGAIKLDDEHVSGLNIREWYDLMAYIPQTPYIFPLSLADNVRFYAPEASDDDIKQVIDHIGLRQFVNTLPHGIDEPIGEGGRMLSGGQEQRIAIARALLSDKPVILLDEPTAHLDIETEYEIKQVMREVFRDRQVILATHRLHWMNDMDYIYMLKEGMIAEEGTHNELAARDGAYTQFIQRRGETGL